MLALADEANNFSKLCTVAGINWTLTDRCWEPLTNGCCERFHLTLEEAGVAGAPRKRPCGPRRTYSWGTWTSGGNPRRSE